MHRSGKRQIMTDFGKKYSLCEKEARPYAGGAGIPNECNADNNL